MRACFSLIQVVVMMFACKTTTPPFREKGGEEVNSSIAVLRKIDINDSKQWITIRGENVKNPWLLFLHGGPGTTTTALIRKFLPELEEKFCVVHWDQRGAGKSFAAGRDRKRFTVDQMIQDVGSLSKLILNEYSQKKLYVMGVSWGSFLGIEAVKRWPNYYEAYLGSGQIVYQELGEQLSYAYTLQHAISNQQAEEISTLEKIGPPPYRRHVRHLIKQRRLLSKYRGSFYHKGKEREFTDFSTIWDTEEYALIDKVNWIRGQLRSERILGPEFRKIDFRETAKKLDVPIFIAQGKHDMQTPTSLVIEYFDLLQSPLKRLQVFSNSGHLPLVEEKTQFLNFLDELLSEIPTRQ